MLTGYTDEDDNPFQDKDKRQCAFVGYIEDVLTNYV